jgi:hypothetical protein
VFGLELYNLFTEISLRMGDGLGEADSLELAPSGDKAVKIRIGE